MRLPLADYLTEFARAFVISAREATKESLWIAEHAEELEVDVPIGGVLLKVEGAANLPESLLLMKETKMSTSAFVELDGAGKPQVTLKRRLFRESAEVEFEMVFERVAPLNSLEIARDRANEVNRNRVQQHRLRVTVDGTPVDVPVLDVKEDEDA